jgi:chemotaxis protein MotB
MADNQPIIIKKVKKGGHGHHGGAWKLAYADFVTAMMAFFLLMWLLGTTDPSYRQGIAEYFKDPWKPSVAGGANTGDATSVLKGGGEDLTQSEGQVKLTNKGKEDIVAEAGESEADKAKDEKRLEALKDRIEQMIDTDPLLKPYEDQLKIDITEEGLRIQIIDEEGRPMFNSASAKMAEYAAAILHEIAPVVNELPNKISIAGHTDAKPFPGGGQGYTNWELSADRANAARKELIKGGLKEEKMMRVVGLSSSVPLVKDDPLHATNRRISITVMNRHTADEILSGDGSIDVSASQPLDQDKIRGIKPAPPAAAPEPPPVPEQPKGIPGTLTGGGRPPEAKPGMIPGTLTGKRGAPAPKPAPEPEPEAPAPEPGHH